MSSFDRRTFLYRAGIVSAAASLNGISFAQGGEKKTGKENEEIEVTPTEDLMREHGLLNRILLIYDHCTHALEANEQFDVTTLASAAGIIRQFIEQYHEKLEEVHIFTRFEKAGNSRPCGRWFW